MFPVSKTAKDSITFIVTGITVAACIAFVLILVHALWYAPDESASADIAVPQRTTLNSVALPATSTSEKKAVSNSTSTSNQLVAEYPSRLVIPAINIDAHVKSVGLTADGNMATPGNFVDVGWYKYGTVPGNTGSAVIDGHVDNGLALAGVFKHLGDLKKGDDVYIKTNSGEEIHFVVSAVEQYPHDSLPSDYIFNDKSGSRIRLITCTGSWIANSKTYDERLVVTADKV